MIEALDMLLQSMMQRHEELLSQFAELKQEIAALKTAKSSTASSLPVQSHLDQKEVTAVFDACSAALTALQQAGLSEVKGYDKMMQQLTANKLPALAEKVADKAFRIAVRDKLLDAGLLHCTETGKRNWIFTISAGSDDSSAEKEETGQQAWDKEIAEMEKAS